jgi:crotonobetainyl-CoA:carnitine CoA-transferase CaiB-like acyl-CoA transferase
MNPSLPDAALSGVRVLDLSTVIFGPYAAQMLAEYGADVIKVETPDGDSTRKTGPAAEEGWHRFSSAPIVESAASCWTSRRRRTRDPDRTGEDC